MHTLVNQLEASLESGHYYLSLFTALALPDIAGALGSPNGEAKRSKYISWYEEWVRPRCHEALLEKLPEAMHENISEFTSPFEGSACYQFRCSMLHQGTTQHEDSPFPRIIFVEPGASSNSIHYSQMNDALCIDLTMFCREVIAGVRLWLGEVEGTEPFTTNYGKFVRRHEQGLKPYIGGVPVIG